VKAVICTASGGVHIHTPGVGKWETCQCGNAGAKWEDPEAGKLIVAAGARSQVSVLGLHNQLLRTVLALPVSPSMPLGQLWEEYRHLHDAVTDAPGYVFDKSRAGCWAVALPVGSTSDIRWATDAEYKECFPS